ncbi:MAG TPA: RidA family protein [Devosia sp.]|nr:RidA family protein [Devosia sp.]
MIEYPGGGDTPRSHLPFSPVVRVGNLLFVSGQASVDATGKIVPDTFEGEFRRSLENLRKILEDSGSSLKHVVRTTNYIRDSGENALYNQLYREYFSAPFPARTTIGRVLPETLRYEIDCIAVVP